jgi:hypothetical protein
MLAVGAGMGLAGSIASLRAFPAWVPLVVAFGIAVLAVLYTHYNQPVKVTELRRKLLQAVIAGPVAAVLMWQLVKQAT